MALLPTQPEMLVTADTSGVISISHISSRTLATIAPVMQTMSTTCGKDLRSFTVLEVHGV